MIFWVWMDSKLLRLSSDVITPVLTKMFNLCVISKHILCDWKYARVTPMFKRKGDKNKNE